jgi:hypothetical protein
MWRRKHGEDDNVPDLRSHGLWTAPALRAASHSDRVRLYPGTKGFRQAFQKLCRGEAALQCTISFENTIAAFLATELKPQDELRHLVVLTGKKHMMWSTTCEEYVSRTWPKVSDPVLSLYERIGRPTEIDKVIDLMADKPHSLIRVKLKTKPMSNLTDKRRLLQVTLEATREQLLDVIEAVAWLFATAYSAQDLVLRGVRLERQFGPSFLNFDLRCDSMKPVTEKGWSSICWIPLMPCYPIAVDFETPARDLDIKGVEISFHLMCFLCGLEYAVEEEGGLVLYGQKSAVWPTQASDDCVEWHFQRREDTFEGQDEEPFEKTRLCMSIDHLESWSAQKRHFLGLWADPVVTLGTSISDGSRVEYSQAREVRYTHRRHGRQIGGTIACPRIFSLTWTEVYTIAENRRNIYMENFESKVHARRNTPVMLYSISERRAWIVSFLSVLWHLARARSSYQRVLGFRIPPCAQSADGGQAAFDRILGCYRRPLKGSRPREIVSDREQRVTIKDYLNEVWASLDCATRETNRARRPWGNTIYGYEMADIVFLKPDLYMKQHKLNFRSGWTPLVDEVKLVLFYEGLRDPIESDRDHLQHTICSRTIWQNIPPGYNLLTVSLPCLIDIAQRFGPNLSRLTGTHQWHSPTRDQLLGPCGHPTEHICDRLQEVRRAPDHVAPPHLNLLRDRRGAVVFKYAIDMERIQRELNFSLIVHRGPPLPAQVALERGYPNDHAQRAHSPPAAREMPPINAQDGFRRPHPRRRSSRSDHQGQNQQLRPSTTRTQQRDDDEVGRCHRRRKETRQRVHRNKPRTKLTRRCPVM